MTDQTTSTTGTVVVPDDLKKQFPKLIDLIMSSESMNDEERQYWINILPVMSEDQVANLQGILENERDQLAAIDAKYSTTLDPAEAKAKAADFTKKRADRKQKRTKAEAEAEASESASEADILSQIDSL